MAKPKRPAAEEILVIEAFLLARKSVSYTHLDVYKRQDQPRAGFGDAEEEKRVVATIGEIERNALTFINPRPQTCSGDGVRFSLKVRETDVKTAKFQRGAGGKSFDGFRQHGPYASGLDRRIPTHGGWIGFLPRECTLRHRQLPCVSVWSVCGLTQAPIWGAHNFDLETD